MFEMIRPTGTKNISIFSKEYTLSIKHEDGHYIIFSSKMDDIICQTLNEAVCEYCKKIIKYKYAKTLFITCSYIEYLKEEEQIIINSLDELKPALKKLKFNAVYLIGFNYNQVQEYFLKSENISTLF